MTRMQLLPLSDIDIARAFICPHWPYWERFGNPALRRQDDEASPQDLFERLWMERDIIASIAPDAVWIDASTSLEAQAEQTRELMQMGAPAIAKPVLATNGRLGQPSLLIKRGGTSNYGAWSYAPLDIRRVLILRKEEAFRLYFYAELLQDIQGSYPLTLSVVNRDGQQFEAGSEQWHEEYRVFLQKLERSVAGECPAPVYRKGCEDTSPWGQACRTLAAERDDVALVFSITQKQLESLRSQGIETVHQLAELDIATLEESAPGLTLRSLLRLQRQARSLIDRTVLVREPWEDALHDTDVFFDIESHPGTDQDYLYGLLVRPKEGPETYTSLHTLNHTSEATLWAAFLALLETLPPNYRVYHYGDYEYTRLVTLAERYGTMNNPWLIQFLDRLIDVKELVRDCLVLPLFFYSLKQVAGFFGYRWQEGIRHGRDSVREYEHWLAVPDDETAKRLLAYNKDDVQALVRVVDWARTWAMAEAVYPAPYPWEPASATLRSV